MPYDPDSPPPLKRAPKPIKRRQPRRRDQVISPMDYGILLYSKDARDYEITDDIDDAVGEYYDGSGPRD